MCLSINVSIPGRNGKKTKKQTTDHVPLPLGEKKTKLKKQTQLKKLCRY